jgi:hypothetical protein
MRLRACLANVLKDLPCDARPEPIQRTLGPLSVSTGLIADGFQFNNAILQHRVGEIGNAVLDRVVEPLELGVRFGRSLAQCGNVCRLPLGPLPAAVEHGGQDLLETGRLQKTPLDVIGHEAVELLHRDGAAHALVSPSRALVEQVQ